MGKWRFLSGGISCEGGRPNNSLKPTPLTRRIASGASRKLHGWSSGSQQLGSRRGLARAVRPRQTQPYKIGKSHGTSVSQVALAWLITYYDDTVVAIPGASCPEQAGESAAAMSLRLTENELARIEEISVRVAKY